MGVRLTLGPRLLCVDTGSMCVATRWGSGALVITPKKPKERLLPHAWEHATASHLSVCAAAHLVVLHLLLLRLLRCWLLLQLQQLLLLTLLLLLLLLSQMGLCWSLALVFAAVSDSMQQHEHEQTGITVRRNRKEIRYTA